MSDPTPLLEPEVPESLRPWLESGLAVEALTHASWAHEHGGGDNERLEFLGDAVLQLCVTGWLVERFPDAGEGELSRMRQRFVNTVALADVGRRLGLGPALRLGLGEDQSGGRDRARVLAGATEAILGVVYRDRGFDAVNTLVRSWVEDMAERVEHDAVTGYKDPRSLLQERVQRDHGATPTYEVVQRDGPAHAPTFAVEVRVGERVLGLGQGTSKREACRRAAERALAPPSGEGT